MRRRFSEGHHRRRARHPHVARRRYDAVKAIFDDYFRVNVTSFALSTLLAIVAVALTLGAFRIADVVLFRSIDFVDEIKRGNVAAAIVAGAVLITVGLVISGILR